MWSSARPIRSISRPSLDPSVGILLNVTEDHLDRHGTMANYAAVKERLAAKAQREAVVGVDDDWCAAVADRMQSAGAGACAASRSARCWTTAISSTVRASCWPKAARPRVVADLNGIASLRGIHNAQNAAAACRCRAGAGCRCRLRFSRACGPFPASRTVWNSLAGRGACCSSTIPRRPMRTRPPRRWSVSTTSSGSSAARPKTGGIDSLREFFPRVAQGLSDRRGGGRFRAHAGWQRDLRTLRHADNAVVASARRRRGLISAGACGAAVAGLRIVRPISKFRSARRCLPQAGARAAGVLRGS